MLGWYGSTDRGLELFFKMPNGKIEAIFGVNEGFLMFEGNFTAPLFLSIWESEPWVKR
jgi:hypothetical protein